MNPNEADHKKLALINRYSRHIRNQLLIIIESSENNLSLSKASEKLNL